jgi:Oxidoreductase-like protein, N-terminal.
MTTRYGARTLFNSLLKTTRFPLNRWTHTGTLLYHSGGDGKLPNENGFPTNNSDPLPGDENVSLMEEKTTKRVSSRSNLVAPDPPPEGLCCGSGCAKCVWLVYAEELMVYHNDGGEMALKSLDKVPDPNIREFLKMELRMRMK